MQDQDFIYLPADSSRPFMPAGFYRWVAKGKMSVLQKSSKRIDEFEDGLKMKQRFLGSEQFYILKDGHYYQIKKKNDLLLLAGDKRKEVVRYLKQNRISFKNMREQALSGAADIYNR